MDATGLPPCQFSGNPFANNFELPLSLFDAWDFYLVAENPCQKVSQSISHENHPPISNPARTDNVALGTREPIHSFIDFLHPDI
jgi:hypothetical protein